MTENDDGDPPLVNRAAYGCLGLAIIIAVGGGFFGVLLGWQGV